MLTSIYCLQVKMSLEAKEPYTVNEPNLKNIIVDSGEVKLSREELTLLKQINFKFDKVLSHHIEKNDADVLQDYSQYISNVYILFNDFLMAKNFFYYNFTFDKMVVYHGSDMRIKVTMPKKKIFLSIYDTKLDVDMSSIDWNEKDKTLGCYFMRKREMENNFVQIESPLKNGIAGCYSLYNQVPNVKYYCLFVFISRIVYISSLNNRMMTKRIFELIMAKKKKNGHNKDFEYLKKRKDLNITKETYTEIFHKLFDEQKSPFIKIIEEAFNLLTSNYVRFPTIKFFKDLPVYLQENIFMISNLHHSDYGIGLIDQEKNDIKINMYYYTNLIQFRKDFELKNFCTYVKNSYSVFKNACFVYIAYHMIIGQTSTLTINYNRFTDLAINKIMIDLYNDSNDEEVDQKKRIRNDIFSKMFILKKNSDGMDYIKRILAIVKNENAIVPYGLFSNKMYKFAVDILKHDDDDDVVLSYKYDNDDDDYYDEDDYLKEFDEDDDNEDVVVSKRKR